jgi:hypothetical protein
MGGQVSELTAIWTMALLAAVFSLKHFFADFVLQTRWIALGKDRCVDWLAPLAAHVAIHAGLTLVIALIVAPRLWWLALIDLTVHFAIDRGKSVAGRLGGCSPEEARYWWLFGFDQLLHQFTNLGLALALMVL